MGTVWKQLRALGTSNEGLSPARPPTPGSRFARGLILTALGWAIFLAFVGLYADAEFIASSRMYSFANVIGVSVCAALLLPGVWLACTGHFNADFYQLTRPARAAFIPLAVAGTALTGLLAWSGTIIGLGWILHHASETQNQVREYTIVKPRAGGPVEVWCDEAIYLDDAHWPNNRICEIDYRDWISSQSGASIRLSGTVSEFGFVMDDYELSPP